MAAHPDPPYLVALTTFGSMEEARSFVRELVNRRLVACGTILPQGTSIYRWEGTLTEATEAVVLLKTRGERWADLLNAVRTLHPYDVPELLALPVEHGLQAYLDWMASETTSGE
ncbi:MAG: divalent-cation tolerance protein CutA [Gemmatimonadetes bacterium]|nr:divalent-cation tolerance protein CutA [Gemmatimonadota bacterium]